MTNDIAARWAELDPAHGKRAEFAAIVRDSGRSLNTLSHRSIEGAENLLSKALVALDADDQGKVDRLVGRAAAMPYDPREERSPGVAAATLMVYELVVDEFEASDWETAGWLDTALAVLDRVGGPGRADLASVIHGLVLQEDFFDLSPGEKRRIVAAVGDAPLEADHGDGPGTTPVERAVIIRSLLATALALTRAYADPRP